MGIFQCCCQWEPCRICVKFSGLGLFSDTVQAHETLHCTEFLMEVLGGQSVTC